jgi:hypothetical protein
MQTQNDFEEVTTLYRKLKDCIRANNHDQVKRVYRKLVRADRPLSEILEQGRNIPTPIKRFEQPDGPPQQSLLPQFEQDTFDLTCENPDQLVSLLFVREGSDITSISPPDPVKLPSPQSRTFCLNTQRAHSI